jgi:hypothetical protein
MQNKPNFRKAKMDVNSILTKAYENKPRLRTPAKQTQSNPILSASGGFKRDTYAALRSGNIKNVVSAGMDFC